MKPSIAPVLIVGAGPTGLVAALTLVQNGVPVRIIDKELHHHVGMRGAGIWPRTFEAFHLLRAPEVSQRAKPTLPIREYKAGALKPTKTFVSLPHSDPTPATPYCNPTLIGQSVVEGILRSHVETYGCSVELGTELVSFEDDGDRVLTKLVKKMDGDEIVEMFEASYVIGADGARGVTRKQLGLTFLGETKQDMRMLIGDLCLETKDLDRECSNFFGTRPDLLMLRPMDDIAPNGFQMVLNTPDLDPKQLLADEKQLCQYLSKFTGREIDIKKVVCLSEYRPNVRMVNKFGVGRVFVAGDAAHIHGPAGGQGLNTSVQDALNLSWKVALVYKGLSSSSLLDTYDSERLPVVAEMLNLTTMLFEKVHKESALERGMYREKKMNMLGVNCRWSSIVVDEYNAHAEPVSAYRALEEGVLVAGDRSPDAPGLIVVGGMDGLKRETRLFDVFSVTYHTALVFAPDVASAQDVLEMLRKYAGDVILPLVILPRRCDAATTKLEQVDSVGVVMDCGGHAYQAYLAVEGEMKVVVVRPDGVAGAIVHGAQGVETYLSRIFA